MSCMRHVDCWPHRFSYESRIGNESCVLAYKTAVVVDCVKWVLSSLWRPMNNMSVAWLWRCAQQIRRFYSFLLRAIFLVWCSFVCAPGWKFRQVRLPQSSSAIGFQRMWLNTSNSYSYWHFTIELRMWQMIFPTSLLPLRRSFCTRFDLCQTFPTKFIIYKKLILKINRRNYFNFHI